MIFLSSGKLIFSYNSFLTDVLAIYLFLCTVILQTIGQIVIKKEPIELIMNTVEYQLPPLKEIYGIRNMFLICMSISIAALFTVAKT